MARQRRPRELWLNVRRRRRGLAKQLHRHAVVFDPPPPHFRPHIVAPTRRHDRELLARKLGERGQLVLSGAEFLERLLRFDRQQLIHDADDGIERQAARREIDLPRRRHDVGLLADVHHQGFAVELDDRLKERGNKAHELEDRRLARDCTLSRMQASVLHTVSVG